MMNKRTYEACAWLDENGDSKYASFERVPFLRGYHWSDGYGVSKCLPCKEAKDPEAIEICNNKYAYSKVDFPIDDLNDAKMQESSQNISHGY